FVIAVFGEPVRQHATGAAGAHNDEIKFACCFSHYSRSQHAPRPTPAKAGGEPGSILAIPPRAPARALRAWPGSGITRRRSDHRSAIKRNAFPTVKAKKVFTMKAHSSWSMTAPAERLDFAEAARTLASSNQRTRERRRFRRAPLIVAGRMLDPLGREHDCRTMDISPGDVRIAASILPEVGQKVVLYLEGFGRVS